MDIMYKHGVAEGTSRFNNGIKDAIAHLEDWLRPYIDQL